MLVRATPDWEVEHVCAGGSCCRFPKKNEMKNVLSQAPQRAADARSARRAPGGAPVSLRLASIVTSAPRWPGRPSEGADSSRSRRLATPAAVVHFVKTRRVASQQAAAPKTTYLATGASREETSERGALLSRTMDDACCLTLGALRAAGRR